MLLSPAPCSTCSNTPLVTEEWYYGTSSNSSSGGGGGGGGGGGSSSSSSGNNSSSSSALIVIVLSLSVNVNCWSPEILYNLFRSITVCSHLGTHHVIDIFFFTFSHCFPHICVSTCLHVSITCLVSGSCQNCHFLRLKIFILQEAARSLNQITKLPNNFMNNNNNYYCYYY
jgi:hypothetical protein